MLKCVCNSLRQTQRPCWLQSQRLTLAPHLRLLRAWLMAFTATQRPQRVEQRATLPPGDCEHVARKLGQGEKRKSQRSQPDESCSVWQEATWSVHTGLRAMTGLGAVDSGRVPINRHVRPACSPSPKHSRNGLHDTLQRALGPDLGHKQLPRLFTVCCYLPSHLSPTATETSATRSVFVQVTAPHHLRRRHTAAYAKDSSPRLPSPI